MRNKHAVLMLACCLIPLAALGMVYLFHASTSSVLFYGLVLLCPALHFVMMRGMMGEHTHHEKQPVEAVNPHMAEPTEEVLPRHTGVKSHLSVRSLDSLNRYLDFCFREARSGESQARVSFSRSSRRDHNENLLLLYDRFFPDNTELDVPPELELG